MGEWRKTPKRYGAQATVDRAEIRHSGACLSHIEGESIGWLPLGEGAYLQVSDPDGDVITVVGVPDARMAGMNVVLVG